MTHRSVTDRPVTDRPVTDSASHPTPPILGIHHVTAIAGDPQKNLDVYVGLLGLRLVKKTVNFDDPTTYHLYYGDAAGSPGSILTFFPWAGARRGAMGAGQTQTTAFAVPVGSLDAWRRRLRHAGVTVTEGERFGEPFLAFADHDGLRLELIANVRDDDPRPAWDGVVDADIAIRGFDGVTLFERDAQDTADLLVDAMGLHQIAAEGRRLRFVAGDGSDRSGARVDVLADPQAGPGRVAAGSVHHVAFRAANDDSQRAWRQHLLESGAYPTEVKDRNYFHSIYYREPGGVLFELATDPPGFAIDEAPEALGTTLMLPSWLEPARDRIEAVLPPLGAPRPLDAGADAAGDGLVDAATEMAS